MMDEKKKASTVEELEKLIDDECHTETDLQETSSELCNQCAAELRRILGEKDLECLRGGRRIVNVNDVPRIPGYTWLTASALRHILRKGTPQPDFHGNPLPTNGLDKYGTVINIGQKGRKRVLIDLDAFDKWLDEHREWPLKPPPSKK